jgi:tripartite-type tricarboxylate transporter receptor subunit TctC
VKSAPSERTLANAPRRCTLSRVALFCIALDTAGLVAAQPYPAKPIRFIVPHSVSGSPDILARFLATKLGEAFGQQVIVENHPGAGGVVGAERAARAAPDGYTLVTGSSAIVINPSLYRKVGYDVQRDFQGITALASAPLVLVVHPSLPVRSTRELIALARARPGAINYASGGSGSAAHMAAELFKSMAGVNLLHVPYKGTAPALADLVGGHVSVAFYTVSAIGGHVKSGRLRALALTALQRSPAVPDLPTVAESGLPGYEASTWIGVLAPSNTPRDIIERLHSEIVRILALPEVKQRFSSLGFDIIANTPEQFTAQIKSDLTKWERVIRASGVIVD